MLQYANASLGTVSLTRNAVDRIYLSLRSIQSCVRWSFDAAFDLGAFHCAMNMRPYMEARSNDRILYHSTRSACGKSGMKIEMRQVPPHLSVFANRHHLLDLIWSRLLMPTVISISPFLGMCNLLYEASISLSIQGKQLLSLDSMVVESQHCWQSWHAWSISLQAPIESTTSILAD